MSSGGSSRGPDEGDPAHSGRSARLGGNTAWTQAPALLFPRLKAVYGQNLEGHQWNLT